MQFNGETDGLDLYHDALDWAGTNSEDYTIDEFTRNANFALDRVTSIILESDTTWKWRDDNLSSELIDTSTTLVANTEKYPILLPWLKIRRVRVKEPNGQLSTLRPKQRNDLNDSQLRGLGTPTRYFLLGGFLYLNSIPNYGFANGIEVQYQTGADKFIPTDTTKEPGFDSTYHRLISFHAALDYVDQNSIPNRGNTIRDRIGNPPNTDEGVKGKGMEGALANAYSDRENDAQPHIRLHRTDYGAQSLGSDVSPSGRGFNF